MERATGYSLWLVPSGSVCDQLAQIIRTIGKAHDTPVFQPHVTLLGGLQEKESTVIARTKKLCEVLQPFTIRLLRIEFGVKYFRCLYYGVEKTIDLLNAYTRVCDMFRVSQGQFKPHLSLMYGDISQSAKEKAKATVRSSVNTFTVEHLDLVLTDGTVKDWHKVQRFTL